MGMTSVSNVSESKREKPHGCEAGLVSLVYKLIITQLLQTGICLNV